MTTTIAFGGNRYNRIAIDVRGYAHMHNLTNYHDANWLRVQVSVSVGAFSGQYSASFITDELVRFQKELAVLHATLKGNAKFETLEGQLALDLKGNGLGAIELRGVAQDVAGIGSTLKFSLSLDQTQIAVSLQELNEIIIAYPVRNV